MPFQVLIKDYKSDRIYRIFRIFFAFPEERQKVITLFEKTDWNNSGKSLAYNKLLLSRLWAGLYFLSIGWRLKKIKNASGEKHGTIP